MAATRIDLWVYTLIWYAAPYSGLVALSCDWVELDENPVNT